MNPGTTNLRTNQSHIKVCVPITAYTYLSCFCKLVHPVLICRLAQHVMWSNVYNESDMCSKFSCKKNLLDAKRDGGLIDVACMYVCADGM